MAESARLEFKLTADGRQAVAAVEDTRKKIGASVEQVRASASRSFSQMRESVNSFGQTMQSVGARMTAVITLPLVGLGTAAVVAATKMDSMKRGLAAVEGSAEGATAALAKLRETAKLPGLGLEEAIQGYINLRAVKLNADLAERSLTSFGNALATAGKGRAELDGVVLALTQIVSKGKVSAEEINQIAERVPQIREAMKGAFGTADTEVLQKKGLSPEKFIEGVVAQLEKLPKIVGGPMNDFENALDAGRAALVALGEAILPFVSQVLAVLTPALEQAVAWFRALPDSTKTSALAFAAVLAVAGPLVTALGALVAAVSAVGAPFAAAAVIVSTAAAALAAAWASNFLGVRDLTNSVLGEIEGFVREHFATITAWYKENLPLIRQTVQTVLNAIRQFWAEHGEQITAVVRAVWGVIKTVVQTGTQILLAAVKLVMQLINEDWAGAWQTFKGILRTALDGTGKVLMGLKDYAASAVRAMLGMLLSLAAESTQRMMGLGEAIVEGIIRGIRNKTEALKNEVKVMALQAVLSGRLSLGIRSPSRVFYEIGENIVEGLLLALRDGYGRVQSAMASLVTPNLPGLQGLRLKPAQATRAAQIGETETESKEGAYAARLERELERARMSEEAYVDAAVKSEERLLRSRQAVITAQRAEANATIKDRADLALRLEELRVADEKLIREHEARVMEIRSESAARQKEKVDELIEKYRQLAAAASADVPSPVMPTEGATERPRYASGPYVDPVKFEEEFGKPPPVPDLTQHKTVIEEFKNVAVSAFGSIMGGFQGMIAGFLAGGPAAQQSFAQMAKAVIAGLAAQSIVLAVMEIAHAIAEYAKAASNPFTAPLHIAAAKMHLAAAKAYGIVGGVAAGIALAIPGGGGGRAGDLAAGGTGRESGRANGRDANAQDDRTIRENRRGGSLDPLVIEQSRNAFTPAPIRIIIEDHARTDPDVMRERMVRVISEDPRVQEAVVDHVEGQMKYNRRLQTAVGNAFVQEYRMMGPVREVIRTDY